MAIMDEDELQDLYQWVDSIPLSRPKRNIARDFADGMLVAEVVKHFFPKLVELHNYPSAHSVHQKRYNWKTLGHKVFKKLNFEVDDEEVNNIVTCVPGSIERFLRALQTKIQHIQQKKIQRQLQQASTEVKQQQAMQSTFGSQGGGAAAPAPVGGAPQHYDASVGGRPASGAMPNASSAFPPSSVQIQIINEKDEMISEMKETIEILELKVRKLEQLVQLKDSKIQSLTTKLQQSGIKMK